MIQVFLELFLLLHILDGNTSKNVSSITIKTNANNDTRPHSSTGGFVNSCFIWANANAQTNAVTGVAASNTQMHVDVANGYISNVVVTSAGSGYIQNPTITIGSVSGTGSINATAQSTGEEEIVVAQLDQNIFHEEFPLKMDSMLQT